MQRGIMATGIVGAMAFCGAAFGQGAGTPASRPAAEKTHPSQEFRDPTNAALVYWPTFWALNEDSRMKLSDAYQGFKDNLFARPNAEVAQLIATKSDMVDQIIRASRIRHADWGVEWSQGIRALLAHLGKLRMQSRILAVDARRLVAEGNVDAAAERVAAMHRIASHACVDNILISSLVGASISSIACTETEMLLADGRLSVKGRNEVLESLAWFDGPDPFRVRAALNGERHWTVTWMRARCTGPEAGKIALRFFADTDENTSARLAATNLAELDEKAVHAELDKLDALFAAAIEAWDAPNRAERIKALDDGVTKETSGMFVMLAPALQKTYESEQRASTRLNDIRARVQSFAPAAFAPAKAPDAAIPSK